MNSIDLTDVDKMILSTIRKNPNNKKSHITEIAEVPWTTANTSIDKLVCNKMVTFCQEETPLGKNTLHILDEFAYLLGVSIGTSHIKVCILDFSFNYAKKNMILSLLDKESLFVSEFWNRNGFNIHTDEQNAVWCANTPSRDLLNIKNIINNLCEFALELNKRINILAIGLAFPGHINNLNNTIVKSSNLNFSLNNVGISTLFKSNVLSRLKDNDINICLEHNVKAAAIAERALGVLKDRNGNNVVLYFGTGLGAAFWLDGKLYRGRTNASGQLGHIKNGYGKGEDCLEQNIRELFGNYLAVKNSSGKELAEWLDKRENIKIKLVDLLSQSIFNIRNLLEIDCMVFSGKLSEIYGSIENLLQEKIIQYDQTSMQVIPSALGEYSAAVGAAIYGYYNCIDFPID